MIRKNVLPDVWDDNWHCTAAQQSMDIEDSASLVLCNPSDAPLFMLHDYDGYRICDDIKNLSVQVRRGARLNIYRLQGPNTPSRHITEMQITMHDDAQLSLCTVTLGGSHVRNNIIVRMQGENCQLEADGLYLIDREQQCDNYIFVEHAKPRCHSRELYKGIVDDSARARFNGHVLVQDYAVKTEAYQTNRNILLTDKAHVDTRPFLEIYNDDVKCSHGSTIGQLDEQALFYLMTRGISQRTAITMLSYAFCDEVIRNINIPSLRNAVGDMVKKRLHGELSSCADCAIACSNPCNGPDAHFDIDPTKL